MYVYPLQMQEKEGKYKIFCFTIILFMDESKISTHYYSIHVWKSNIYRVYVITKKIQNNICMCIENNHTLSIKYEVQLKSLRAYEYNQSNKNTNRQYKYIIFDLKVVIHQLNHSKNLQIHHAQRPRVDWCNQHLS